MYRYNYENGQPAVFGNMVKSVKYKIRVLPFFI